VDELFNFILDLNYIFFAIIFAMTVYFVVMYRHNNQNTVATSDVSHNTLWEGAWAFIPLILCLIMFVWGFRVFMNQSTAPENALEINVTGKKWQWNFKYAHGGETEDLYVPAGRPVKLLMTSKDVLHSFFVPDFRIKSDVIPKRYTTVWFEAKEPGKHLIYCTEYCGTRHSGMLRQVHVLSEEDYAAKYVALTPKDNLTPVEKGEKLYKNNCASCHSNQDGQRVVGPSFWGIYGRKGETEKGESYVADEEYIRESIMNPMAKIVKGYPAAMPAFKGQLDIDDMNAIIAYMKTLK